jgi:hypothetical protein
MERKEQVVEALLSKPSKKPTIGHIHQSDVLKRAAAFMPGFAL